MARKNLLIFCGGRSAEHEVALLSALNVVAAVDRSRFEVAVVGILRDGTWIRLNPDAFVHNATNAAKIRLAPGGEAVALTVRAGRGVLLGLAGGDPWPVDVAFPVLHGTYGEDGTIQGLLEMMSVPYVGCDPMSSANCMDKAVTKQLLRDAGLAVAPWLTLTPGDALPEAQTIAAELHWPVFVKPARLGSSIGISKATDMEALWEAVDLARRYDHKVLIEAAMPGREIECAVLGNENPRASMSGEVIPRGKHDYYSYAAKYLDANGATLVAPAELAEGDATRVQEAAVAAFEALSCSGMARVDFFLIPNGDLIVNEINTIPGFTPISMYPRLWQLTGMTYQGLVAELIRLGETRHAARRKLCTE